MRREGAREAAASPDIERAVAAVRRALPGDAADEPGVGVAEHVVGGVAEVVVRLRHARGCSVVRRLRR